jgi:hypothetical protein
VLHSSGALQDALLLRLAQKALAQSFLGPEVLAHPMVLPCRSGASMLEQLVGSSWDRSVVVLLLPKQMHQ